MNWRTVAADAAIVLLGLVAGHEISTDDVLSACLLCTALALVVIGRLSESLSIARERVRNLNRT